MSAVTACALRVRCFVYVKTCLALVPLYLGCFTRRISTCTPTHTHTRARTAPHTTPPKSRLAGHTRRGVQHGAGGPDARAHRTDDDTTTHRPCRTSVRLPSRQAKWCATLPRDGPRIISHTCYCRGRPRSVRHGSSLHTHLRREGSQGATWSMPHLARANPASPGARTSLSSHETATGLLVPRPLIIVSAHLSSSKA